MAKIKTDPKSMAEGLGIAPAKATKQTERRVRINFDVSEAEHRKLKMMAAAQGKTVAALLRECIKSL